MIDLALNQEQDLIIENEDIALLKNNKDIAVQSVRIRLLTFYGEWAFDNQIGTPYLEAVLGFKPDITFIDNIFRLEIEKDILISKVDDIGSIYRSQGRVLEITFTATTEENIQFEDTINLGGIL